jgi:hypothetical protein
MAAKAGFLKLLAQLKLFFLCLKSAIFIFNMATSGNFEYKPYYCILVGNKELARATRFSTYN